MPDETQWESFFNPELIVEKLFGKVILGNAAEFGCGYGTFTGAIARRTKGLIYAFDIEESMVERTNKRLKELKNLEVLRRDLEREGTGLPGAFVEAVALFNILHGQDPLRLLKEAFRIMSPGAKVAAIHWNYDPLTPRGPSLFIRPKPQDIQKWMLEAGFKISGSVLDLPPYHYGIKGIKPLI
jgi:SAM-dependent methyltransferase